MNNIIFIYNDIGFIFEVHEDEDEDELSHALNVSLQEYQSQKHPLKQYDKLKTEILTQDNTDKCSICYDMYQNSQDIIHLPCKHYYHKDCILPWLKENNTCPCCRIKID